MKALVWSVTTSFVDSKENKLDDRIVWNAHNIQYSARKIWLSVHKLFTSCIRRGLVSRDSMSMVIGCLRLSDASVIRRVVNPRRTSQKISGGFCTECTGQGNDFELIPMVK